MNSTNHADAASGRAHEETVLALPWYATGRLDPDEAARVEAHLAICAECSDDLVVERGLQRALTCDAGIEHGAQGSLHKLWARIDAASTPVVASGPSVRVRAAAARPIALAAGILLSFGLGLLAATLWRTAAAPEDAGYRTAAAAGQAVAPRGTVRAVFDGKTPVERVTRILDGAGLVIVDGPGATGIFTLAPAPGREGEYGDVIDRLRRDPGVRLAEPIGDVAREAADTR